MINATINKIKKFAAVMLLMSGMTLAGCMNGETVAEPTQPVAAPSVDAPLVTQTPNEEKNTVAEPSGEAVKPTATVTPTPTDTPVPTPTEIPHIEAAEMFSEAYFAIIKERLQTYSDDKVGDSLKNSRFGKYEVPYNAEDYYDYEIKGDKVIFHFTENGLTGAEHPAFDYECRLSEAINFMYFNPDGTERYRAPIRDLDPNAKMIALTYDDGPNPAVEQELLKLLDKYNAKATFFFLAKKCEDEGNKDIILKILEEGHDVESHTYGHVYFTKQDWDREEIWTEQNKANLILANIMGHAPEYVRLPGGCSIDYFTNLPMPRIGWSWGALDWENRGLKSNESQADMLKRKAKETFDNVTEHASDGFVILMHSTYAEAPEATEMILKNLTDRGFICVTLSELFYYKGITPENGISYGVIRKKN